MKIRSAKILVLLSILIPLSSCSPHQHSYREEWKHDNQEHWQVCECGEESEKEKHHFNEEIITPTTNDLSGTKKYTCTVCAYSYVGQYYDVPSAPLNFDVELSNSHAHLSWEEPNNNGGKTITHYEVLIAGEGQSGEWVTVSKSDSHIFSGISTDVSYDFKVRAVNSIGKGASAEVINRQLSGPSKVQNIRYTSMQDHLMITFDEPEFIGSSPILKYQAYCEYAYDQNFYNTSLWLFNLPIGEEIEIFIWAENYHAQGEVTSIKVVNGLVPNAPTNLNLIIDDNDVTFTWDAPEPNGSSPILFYEVCAAHDGDSYVYTNVGLVTSYTFNDLIYGEYILFYVRAVNAHGYSDENIIEEYLSGQPGEIPYVKVAAGNKLLRLEWGHPVNYGIYDLYCEISLDNGVTWEDTYFFDAVKPYYYHYEAENLTNGVEYTFLIRANSMGGYGDIVTIKGTPIAVPSKVTNLVVNNGNECVYASWDDPLDDADFPITHYEIKTISTDWINVGLVNEYVLEGLSNNSADEFQIRAVNANGPGFIEKMEIKPTDIVPPPAYIELFPADFANNTQKVKLSVGYVGSSSAEICYEVKKDNGEWIRLPNGLREYTFTDLVYGEKGTYYARVITYATVGQIGEATYHHIKTASAPTSMWLVKNGLSVTLTWETPLDLNNESLKYYEVKKSDPSPFKDEKWVNVGLVNSYTFDDLIEGTEYRFEVRAVTDSGPGLESGFYTTAHAIPTTPVINNVIYGANGDVTIEWTKSISGSYIRDYQLSTDLENWVNSYDQTYTFSNLPLDEEITIYLRALDYGMQLSEITSITVIPRA